MPRDRVTVGGNWYDNVACFEKACNLDPSSHEYVEQLASSMFDDEEVTISGIKHTKLSCCLLALKMYRPYTIWTAASVH